MASSAPAARRFRRDCSRSRPRASLSHRLRAPATRFAALRTGAEASRRRNACGKSPRQARPATAAAVARRARASRTGLRRPRRNDARRPAAGALEFEGARLALKFLRRAFHERGLGGAASGGDMGVEEGTPRSGSSTPGSRTGLGADAPGSSRTLEAGGGSRRRRRRERAPSGRAIGYFAQPVFAPVRRRGARRLAFGRASSFSRAT